MSRSAPVSAGSCEDVFAFRRFANSATSPAADPTASLHRVVRDVTFDTWSRTHHDTQQSSTMPLNPADEFATWQRETSGPFLPAVASRTRRSTVRFKAAYMLGLICAVVLAGALGCGSSDAGGSAQTGDEPPDTIIESDTGADGAGGDVTGIGDPDAGGGADADTGASDADGSDGPCQSLGCPCDVDGDCASGYCIRAGASGAPICSERCEGTCPDPDYTCRLLTNSEDDAVRLCVPIDDPFCTPCRRDIDCGRLDAICAPMLDGDACLVPCAADRSCPENSECRRFGPGSNRDENPMCVPIDQVCSGCLDEDGDGYGLGATCLGFDCDDNDPLVHDGAPELCDGRDNNCNGRIDEGFDLLSDVANCGACGEVCDLDNATAICVDGACAVGACDEGWGDCDGDPSNGCETDLNAPDACGDCVALGGVPGGPCGTCGEGTWSCTAEETLSCDDDPGAARLNACGGCASLDAAPETPCGLCDAGTYVCEGNDALACVGDDDPSVVNACGGCGVLDDAPGNRCGTCDSGELVCDGNDALRCVGDRGEDARNSCGGCSTLANPAGTGCGPCGIDRYVCNGLDATVCDGATEANACGGCSFLANAPESACGPCGLDRYVCDGPNATVCDGATTANACGGCASISNPPGGSCGPCGDDRYVCDGTEATTCDGSTSHNVCGGCTTLANPVGSACGPCGLDTYACSGTEATLCGGSTTVNACNGCSTLPSALGTPCGTCDSGETVCNGTEGVRCAGDLGAAARNACGGCNSLSPAVGASCGPCGLDSFVCNGTNATQCGGSTPGNVCGGCSTLSPAVGASCGACGLGSYVCNGSNATRCESPPPPAETCNLHDDNCNGIVDDVPGGCRLGIHVSFNHSTFRHFYSPDLAEAGCCGFTVRQTNAYYLYRNPAPGLAPFHRCFHSTVGAHFYTMSPTCEDWGPTALEGVMGYIATGPIPGTVPLYRSFRPPSTDHYYTTSLAEHEDALNNHGYTGEQIAGYVFTNPGP